MTSPKTAPAQPDSGAKAPRAKRADSSKSVDPRFRKTVKLTLFTDGVIIVLLGVLGALNMVFELAPPDALIGLGLLASGLNYLVPYITLRKSPIRPRWLVVIGITNAGFGVLFITRILPILFRPPILFGVWMIFAACGRGLASFENFKAGVSKWWISLATGGYMLFAAAVVMNNIIAREILIPSWISVIVTGMIIFNEGRKLFAE